MKNNVKLVKNKTERICPMNKYRGSIYIDIEAENEEQAMSILSDISVHLSVPESYSLPDGYGKVDFGGGAVLINGDLIGNSKRCEKI